MWKSCLINPKLNFHVDKFLILGIFYYNDSLDFKKSDKKTTISRKKQKDIKPLKYRSLRKIIKVKIYINGKLYEFTTLRAKALIKYIYQLNIAEIEKYKCAECGKEFIPQRKDTKYCSKKCKNKVSNRNRDLKRKLLKMQM